MSLPLLLTLAAALLADAPRGRAVAVTVDDLPIAGTLHTDAKEREQLTRSLLQALAKHRIHVVGFVIGKNATSREDRALLQLWLDAGHELGNHSFSHLDFTETAIGPYVADLEQGRQTTLPSLSRSGKAVRWFRFPYLSEGDTLEKLQAVRTYLKQSHQQSVPVTIDDQDWTYERPFVEATARKDAAALAEVSDGYQSMLHSAVRHFEERGDAVAGHVTSQILLLHANAVGAAEWDRLFTWLENTGHRFVPVEEALASTELTPAPEFVGPNGPSYWERILDTRKREEADRTVRNMLNEQAAAWNRGDLTAFCSVYSEDATFLSPTGVTRGRDQVLKRYQTKYSSREAMGTLSFDILEVRLTKGMEFSFFGDAVPGRVQGASVAARWILSFPGQAPKSGTTLLTLQPRGSRWLILQDASM